MRLYHLKDLADHMKLPKILNQAKPILVDYCEAFYQDSHWDSVEELLQQLQQDGIDCMESHDDEIMKPRRVLAERLTAASRSKTLKRAYKKRIQTFMQDNPDMKPTNKEKAAMVEPEDWASFQTHMLSEDEPPAKPKPPQGIDILAQDLQRVRTEKAAVTTQLARIEEQLRASLEHVEELKKSKEPESD
jgi:deoxyribodipyrimidine photolyase